jgi:hypothetical protein
MARFPEFPEISYPNQLDDEHQGPKVTITAALCLCFSAVVLATRLMIRWPWPRLFGLDDGAAIAASVRILDASCDGRSDADSICSCSHWHNG